VDDREGGGLMLALRYTASLPRYLATKAGVPARARWRSRRSARRAPGARLAARAAAAERHLRLRPGAARRQGLAATSRR
jgi:hypothetical protein